VTVASGRPSASGVQPDSDDTLELFREFRRTSDRRLRNELVEIHLDLARREAMRFSGRGEPVDDLIQVAHLGIIKAVERFDPSLGVPFTAYARPTVAGELRRHFRDTTWSVHVPRSLKDLHAGLGKAASALAGRLGRQPTAAELAEEVGSSVDEVLEALELRSAYRPTSINATIDPDGTPLDPPAADDGDDADVTVDVMLVRDLLGRLEHRERTIVYLRYFGQLSQSEIAERVGISQVHVSRLLRSSVAMLRETKGLGDAQSAPDWAEPRRQGTDD
jgi:RNA polymerase sigma-B factor